MSNFTFGVIWGAVLTFTLQGLGIYLNFIFIKGKSKSVARRVKIQKADK